MLVVFNVRVGCRYVFVMLLVVFVFTICLCHVLLPCRARTVMLLFALCIVIVCRVSLLYDVRCLCVFVYYLSLRCFVVW